MAIPQWMAWLQHRHYEKAPIREAIIDIQIDQSRSLTLKDLEAIGAAIPDYSARHNLIKGEMIGRLEQGTLTATTKHDQVGFRFVGGQGKHVANFRLDGFSFSRLAPYGTWEQLRMEAQRLWAAYRNLIGPRNVTRVGLRYVNQLDLPADLRDFGDYIRTFPTISSDLPQQLSGFFMQLQVPQPDLGALLILNETLVPPSDPKFVSIILDLDVIKIADMASDNEVWETLDALRVRKNLVFEGCITNGTRELIS